jgi:conserved domain protein
MLGDLSAKYESNGKPGLISNGKGDPGGKSYGCYQLSSKAGSLQDFCRWVVREYPWIGITLQKSGNFDQGWKECATVDPREFATAQWAYIKEKYYDVAVRCLSQNGYHIDKHSNAMRNVLWSRAVQYGTGRMVKMWQEACKCMYNGNNYTGYPNITYVDDKRFDYDLIVAIYKVSKDWIRAESVRYGLEKRFKDECSEALQMLKGER